MNRPLVQTFSLAHAAPWQGAWLPERVLLPATVLLCSCLLCAGLGSYGIFNGNEALYVESAREMLESGALSVPTLNGVPYLEKPPLTVWLLALVMKLVGSHEAALRSVSALGALILVVTAMRFSQLLRLEVSYLGTGVILASSTGLMVMSRAAMPDALLTLFFGVASLAFAAALVQCSRRLARLAAAALGLAALAKGLVAIALFGLIVAAFWLVHPEKRQTITWLTLDPVAALLALSPLLAWLIAAEVAEPGTIAYWIIDEQILRFLGLREPHDYYTGSMFYYAPRLFLSLFPWGGVLLLGWWVSRNNSDSTRDSRSALRRFLWLCVWVPLLFFSISRAKGNHYLAICVPATAFLTAEYLGALLRYKRRWPLIAAVGVSCVPALAMLALWWWRVHIERTAADFFQAQAAAQLLFMGLIVMSIVAVAFALRGWRRWAVGCLAALAIPVQVELNLVGSQVEPFASARPMAQAILREFSGRPVFLYQDFESFAGLAWYLNRTVPVIDTRSSDLYYGHQRRPGHPSFVSEDQVLHSVPGSLVVVMKERDGAFAASSLAAHAKLVRNIGWARLYRIRDGA